MENPNPKRKQKNVITKKYKPTSIDVATRRQGSLHKSKSPKLLATISIILCLGLFVVSEKNAFSQNTGQPSNQAYVSAESMQTYAQTVISEYNKNISQYFSSTRSLFPFYSNGSYDIKSYISFNGAALWFEPSGTLSFENYNLSERVESIFGGNFSTWPLFFEPGHHVMIEGGTFELNGHPLLTLSNISSVIFKDIRVNQTNFLQEYKCIIIKGSIEISYWTSDNATEDAGEIFYSDLRTAFSVSEEVRQRYAEPELTALLQNIINKLQNTSELYSASEWKADIQNIEDIARTKYHISNPSEFINEIIAFLNARTTGVLPTIAPEPTPTPTPTKTIFNRPVDDPDNWIYVGFLGGLPVVDFAFLVVFNDYRRNNKHRALKILLGAIPFVLSLIIGDLLYYYPYDYQMVSIQSLTLLLVWIIGITGIYKGRKRLIHWLFPKQNDHQRTKKQTDEKSEESIKAKKAK